MTTSPHPSSNFQDTSITSLTKKDLILGEQCRKAIWLQEHKPELAAPPDAGALLRYEQGKEVDARARLDYDGGEFVSELDWDAAVAQTAAFIESGATRIYQPAFSALGLRIRVDILDLLPGEQAILREVKMSTRLKTEHILDVSIQALALKQSGFALQAVYLVLINKEHTPENGAPLFHEVEVTKKALALVEELDSDVIDISETVLSETEPSIPIGKHCSKPWPCPFYDYCWQDVPKASIWSIPRLSTQKLDLLKAQEVIQLEDVPSDFDLTQKQWDYVHFQSAGKRTINTEAIRNELASFTYPLYFLDFETHSSPLPPYPGSRPYQQVPFQFSIHVLAEDRTLTHKDYLHTTDSDPREAVAEHLLRFLGDSGTILTYNAQFEIKVLEELAAALPHYADGLNSIVSRVYDQLPLVKKNVQDPFLYRSYSLKTITKVLLNDQTYSTLSIANGEMAHAAWVRMHGVTDSNERQRIIDGLKAYCCQDTLAQVNLHYWCERV